VQEVVAKHYIDLPYHNFEHALDVVERTKTLIERCQKYNIQIDQQAVILSALFHDAGYNQNYETAGFDSKEELSAVLAEQELNKLGFDSKLIDTVKACIIATHRNRPFETIEQKVLRAADLAGLAGPYEEFAANSNLLKREQEYLQARQITDDEWKETVRQLIEFYLSQDIVLTPEHNDEDGVSIFHSRAQTNLDRFLLE